MTPPPAVRARGGAPDRRIAGAVAVVWGGRALQIALSLLLTRALFDHLPEEEVGLWFLLASAAAAGAVLGLALLREAGPRRR